MARAFSRTARILAAALLLALVGGLGLPPCPDAGGICGAGGVAVVASGCCGSVADPGDAEGACACISCLQMPGITAGPDLRHTLAAAYYRSSPGSAPASAIVPPPLRVPIA